MFLLVSKANDSLNISMTITIHGNIWQFDDNIFYIEEMEYICKSTPPVQTYPDKHEQFSM